MVGITVNISLETDAEITPTYLLHMAKEIESLPPENHKYFKNVKPGHRERNLMELSLEN